MEIIPAIDIIDGKCVRLTKGDYSKKIIYNEDPLEAAKTFEDAGLQRLHMVDLNGAKSGSIKNLKVLERVSANTNMAIDFGGGIKKIEDVNSVLSAGALIVTLGSIAVKQPSTIEEWLMEFGAGKFLIGADALGEKIKISGWLEDGGISIFDFIRSMLGIGVINFFCTDISKDGMMKGPAIELYKKIIAEFPSINLIASGGVSSVDDILVLKNIGCKGCIIGKAFYEGKISLNQLSIINA